MLVVAGKQNVLNLMRLLVVGKCVSNAFVPGWCFNGHGNDFKDNTPGFQGPLQAPISKRMVSADICVGVWVFR